MNTDEQTGGLTIAEIAPGKWPDICAQFSDLSFEQSLTYSQAAVDRVGAVALYLGVYNRTGNLVAAVGFRLKTIPGLGKGIAWAPAGPMIYRQGEPAVTACRVHEILESLTRHFDKTGHVLRLRFPVVAPDMGEAIAEHASTLGYTHTARAHSYRSVIVDCSADEDMLMRQLHGKWRNLLRKAMKSDCTLHTAPLIQESARFDRMYREVQSVKGFQPDIPPDFYYDLTGPDFQHDVLIARVGDDDVAGMTIGLTGTNAVYLFGATTHRGRQLNAGYFLMWQAVLACKRKGVRWLDLGGIDPTSNPEVTRFKLRTGGVDVVAPGPFEYRPGGLSTGLILLAEHAYSKLKGKR
ncbi:GNAT family N-acetyltransferase (plasmid) [Aliiroseovarius sp. M344]|uniref:lipid II:glycine glycyltransferase FemX n=1 Tax=Aliiroseovarius sp. M344 TaxID=2867010 RepID=UPI0021AD915F|nr:GNAT family N-acetyltransferase [Aliiroseovarius sp. M344]UWQ16058.1 GNAT family N-acetyltransferase [Aliiroseovarius sp. M344]